MVGLFCYSLLYRRKSISVEISLWLTLRKFCISRELYVFVGYRSAIREERGQPLSYEMEEARWRTFGHILGLSVSTPGQQAMNFYFQCSTNGRKIPRKEVRSTANSD